MPSEAPFHDEKLLRRWFDQLPEAVIEVDEDGHLSYVNPAAQRLLGYTREELKGLDLLRIIVPEDRPLVQGYLRRALEEKTPGPAECVFVRKEGARLPATLSLHAIQQEGQPPTLRGVLIDLTEFRQAQEALREKEERFRLYFERASDVFYSLSPDLEILSVSPSVERLLGYRPEELIGHRLPDLKLLAPSSLEQAVADAQRALEGEHIEAAVYEFIAKDGTSRWGEVSGSALFSPEGRPIAFVSVARDITDRRRAEEARRESEERLRALFEHAPVGMALTDLEGRILSANPTYCRLLGYSPGEMEGMALPDYIYPPDLEEGRRLYRSLAQGEQEACLIDQRLVRKRGEVVWGRLNISLVRYGEGRPQLAIQVCEDITDRRRAEEAMREGEARYRAIMEQASDGIYLVDAENLQILEANPAFLNMLGYSYSEILDLSPLQLVEADPQELEEELSQLLSGKEALSLERAYRRKDGSLLPAWITAQAIAFAGRRAILYLVRDLTVRRRAEQELREHRESLMKILDSIEADIYVADLKSHEVLFLNRHMKESFGEDALGKKCWSVFRGETGPCPCCTNEQLVDEEGNPRGPVIWEGQNPITGRYYLNYDRALRWVDGRMVRMQIALDITARKEAEEALRQSEERYRAIMQQASDGIYLVDRQTRRLIECNESFARMLGYTPEEVTRLTIYDLIAAEREDIDRRFAGMVEAGGTISLERELRRKDGSLVPVWIRGQIITYLGKAVNLSFATDLSERRRAEQALRQSEERYRAVMEQSADGFFLVDAEAACVLEANAAAQRLLGYSASELEGMPLHAFIVAEREEIERRLQELVSLESGHSLTFERTLRKKDGSLVPVWVNGSPLYYGGRRVVLALVRDLSERKRAEQALRNSEERYRAIVEWCPDGIYVVDASTRRIVQSNPAFQHLLGYSAEELVGMHLYDFIAAERQDIDKRFFGLVSQGVGAFFQHERQYRRQDGSLVPVWATGNVVSWGQGQAVFTFVRDLTARKEAEEKLRESEARYRAIMEQSPDGIYLVDPESRYILESNSAFQRLLGYSAEELQGMTLYDLIAADPADIEQRFRSILDLGPAQIFSLERQYRRQDGSLVPVWVTGTPVYYAGKKVVSVLARDLTERKKAEQALRDSEERYRAVAEQSPDGIYLVDVETKALLEVNPAMARLLGYTVDELRCLTPYDFVAAEREDIDARFHDITSRHDPSAYERSFRRKDGSILEAWVSASVIHFGGRRVACFLVRDLSERKETERERERLIKELQEALASVKTLRGLIPICANCKKVRDDQGYWQQVESYVREHSEATFTHGLCPDCARLLFPGVVRKGEGDGKQGG